MKQNVYLPLERFMSSLSLFGILLCMHMSFTLAYFLPSGSKEIMSDVYIFYFTGSAMGAVLCPLFLPLPNKKNKHLFMSLGFIVFLVALEFILRSMGFNLWLNSAVVRSVMAIPEGILTTMSYGLFYLVWLRQPAELPETTTVQANRTSRYCSLVLGAILLASVLARFYSVPLMEKGIAMETPLLGAAFVFTGIKWCMIIIGMSAAACVFLARKSADVPAPEINTTPDAPALKTNWPALLRLLGLATVFTVLNAVLDMQALPLYSDKAIYYPNYLIVAVSVPVLGLMTGYGISIFIRRFIPPVIIFFILLSCLPLFEQNQQINVIMSTLVAIGHYTAWVIFTTAVVEYYAGGFWFYGMSTAIFFSVAFAFLAPVIGPLVPGGTEFRVLFIVIAAVLFMLLSFRFRYIKMPKTAAVQKQEPFSASILETSSLENIFIEHELSQREIEVANLLIKEGYGKKEIGEHLYIAPGTAKIHISKIYQKFDVNNRAEFMALFINGKEK